jgi:membrane-associated protease RseP (regulator of RpoE activity)
VILQAPAETKWDLRWRMLGVPVRVHPSFWIVCILLSGSNSVAFLLAGIAVVFVSILVHEFGHALSARFFGERSNRIVLYAIGGLCIHEDLRLTHGKRIWTLFCGPLAGILLGGAAVLAWVLLAAYEVPISALWHYVLLNAIWINFFWSAVNLFPVFPLDGGQVLREVVQWKFRERGDVFVFTFSRWAAAAAAARAVAAKSVFGISYFTAIFFVVLAVQNYLFRKKMREYGLHSVEEDNQPRQPWERDADWWKKG